MNTMKELYLCGQYRSGEVPNVCWDFQGIFTTKQGAESACKDENYFVAPVELDQELPHETEIGWPGLYFPI